MYLTTSTFALPLMYSNYNWGFVFFEVRNLFKRLSTTQMMPDKMYPPKEHYNFLIFSAGRSFIDDIPFLGDIFLQGFLFIAPAPISNFLLDLINLQTNERTNLPPSTILYSSSLYTVICSSLGFIQSDDVLWADYTTQHRPIAIKPLTNARAILYNTTSNSLRTHSVIRFYI